MIRDLPTWITLQSRYILLRKLRGAEISGTRSRKSTGGGLPACRSLLLGALLAILDYIIDFASTSRMIMTVRYANKPEAWSVLQKRFGALGAGFTQRSFTKYLHTPRTFGVNALRVNKISQVTERYGPILRTPKIDNLSLTLVHAGTHGGNDV